MDDFAQLVIDTCEQFKHYEATAELFTKLRVATCFHDNLIVAKLGWKILYNAERHVNDQPVFQSISEAGIL